jgi:hypothetical protein
VPIGADTTEEKVDAANSLDPALVRLALLVQVLGLAVQEVGVLGAGRSVGL